MGRGRLTEQVQEIAKKHIGREINLGELRLIPYIQYIMVNERKIDCGHVSMGEHDILANWKEEGFVGEYFLQPFQITKEFWDFMCDVLYYSYVNY